MTNPPSGQQFEICAGTQRATIVEVGGGVRCYSDGDRPVLDPYPVAAMCDGAHGAPLIPWPNRLRDGRYRFGGTDYQVPLTEPAKHNAIHGFLRWRTWHPIDHGPGRITMGTVLYPLEGYPFGLDVRVEYTLGDEGLTARTSATNIGDAPCPYGCGHHPYLSPGTGTIDDCTLDLPATTRIVTDEERQLPVGREDVGGTDFDFRGSKILGDLQVDYAFTDLTRGEDGRARVGLAGPDGRTAELWLDRSFPIVEISTGDTLSPQRRRRGLGTEPMTCPPNAFQSGEMLITLDPGESATTAWGARLTETRRTDT
jgi:aldose 1-epimerase